MRKGLKSLFAGFVVLASLVGAIGLGSAHAASVTARPLAAQSHLVAYVRLGNCGGAASTPC